MKGWLIRLAILAIYGISLALPALSGEGQVWNSGGDFRGWEILLFGWSTMNFFPIVGLPLQFAWLANPLLIASLVAKDFEARKVALITAVLALLVSLQPFTTNRIDVGMYGRTDFISFEPLLGYYLWVTAMILALGYATYGFFKKP